MPPSELERTVRDYGFKGAVINGHIRGRYLDDPFFWPILERAEALQVPLYLHPTPPPQPVIQASYVGNFAPEVTAQLAASGWGWHIETAIHVLRIILSGAFDRYPHLQLVIGHLGEALPFMLPRLDHNLPTQLTKLKRPIGAYLRENLYYTFSGFNYTPEFPRPAVSGGGRADHVLGGLSLQLDAGCPEFPGAASAQPRRHESHRPRQRRAPSAIMTDGQAAPA